MHLLQILILAIIQGVAELLPVSSSAHVIMAERWMGLDPTTPEMTMLLVMLHTGTMFATIVYFWKAWIATYFSSFSNFRVNVGRLVVATAATGVVGLALLFLFEKVIYAHVPDFEIEHLFGRTPLMASALAAAGVLIILSSRLREGTGELSVARAICIGAVQGLCLPFRGFSRSGATISAGLALGIARRRAEEFSFALGVVLTPPVIVKEAYRLVQAAQAQTAGTAQSINILHLLGPSLLGMAFSFLAGLLALRWLSKWLEQGRWYVFGIYCLLAAGFVLLVG